MKHIVYFCYSFKYMLCKLFISLKIQRNIVLYIIFPKMSHTLVPNKGKLPHFQKQAKTALGQIHEDDLMFLWTVAINFAIFFAMYKYRKYTIFLHFVIGMGVSIITVLSSMPLLLKTTIPTTNNPTRIHMIVGIAILSVICLEVLLGCLSKILNLCKIPSVLLHYMNKVHAVLGYSLAILCKFQYYYITKHKDLVYWILLSQDILFALLVIARKLTFPSLSQKIEPDYSSISDIKAVTSMNDLREKESQNQLKQEGAPDKDYCIFGNYIFDMNPVKRVHPAGYQILYIVRNREIDRFIYGMFRAELLPNLPSNSHSFKSLDLLGKPIAKIAITYPYKNISDTNFAVTIASIKSISVKCQIYQVELVGQNSLEYDGYSDLTQLGRFYSLTGNNKVTRLYTAVNFLHKSNLDFLRSISLIEGSLSLNTLPNSDVEMQTDRLSNFEGKAINAIPLLMKVYKDGTLPNLILASKAQSLILSPPKGFGLRLNEAEPGTILIIAGGTGIYPFSDLIDLLFKNALLLKGHPLKNTIIRNNPILKNNPFASYKFDLLLACQFLEDIHPVTLKQLQQLTQQANFKLKLKLKQKVAQDQLSGVTLTNSPFEELLDDELKEIKDLSKVWLCGPPKMCQSISSYFDKNYRERDLVHLI